MAKDDADTKVEDTGVVLEKESKLVNNLTSALRKTPEAAVKSKTKAEVE